MEFWAQISGVGCDRPTNNDLAPWLGTINGLIRTENTSSRKFCKSKFPKGLNWAVNRLMKQKHCGVLGIWTQGRGMVGADEATRLCLSLQLLIDTFAHYNLCFLT